jgi:hypothetical protein
MFTCNNCAGFWGSLLEECVIILDCTEEEADVITPQETM